MILPTKHLTPAQSLLGASSKVLERLDRPRSVNQLWEDARSDPGIGNFDRFVLALDLLYLLGAIEISAGLVRLAR